MKTFICIIVSLISIEIKAQCFQSFSSGAQHSLAIKSDGTLWSWGQNNSGELAMNTTASPIYIPQQISNQSVWAKIFAVSDRTFVIKNDGTLWTAGNGDGGSLGTGNQDDVFTLTQVGTDNDWNEVYSGGGTIAKKNNGTLWGWGANIYGQLNLGTNSLEFTPVQISTETNWSKINMALHTLALKSDGTLWACGLNDKGQIGDGTTIDKLNFVQIGTDTNWVDIASGFLFKQSFAIKSNGTLWGWGYNVNDVLGYGLPTQVNVPTQLGTDTNWAKVSAGYYTTIALKSNGTLWRNSATGFEQIGTDTDWVNIYNGLAHFFAMKSDGTLWGLGGNDYGQLGLGSSIQGTTIMTQLNCSAFLGIEDINPLTKIKIYPNPTNEILFIENSTLISIDKITLTDITGKIVLDVKENFSKIDMGTFGSGVYILNISSENRIYNYKIVKK